MAQPTLETLELDAGSGGSKVLIEKVGADVIPASLIAYSTGDGTIEIVTSSSGEELPVRLSATDNAVLDTINTAVELIDNIVLVEDAVHSSGASGVMALVVRNDVLTALGGTDGDYAPLQVNASGALYVSVDGSVTVGSHDVTNAGVFAIQISDTSFAVEDGNALGEGVLVQGDDGTDRKNINVDATTGDVQVDVTNTVTVDLGANNDVTIDGSSIVQAEDAVHGSGDAGVMALVVRNDTLATLAGTDGDYAPLQVNASGALFIQEGSALDVSAATIDATISGAALTSMKLIDDMIVVEDAAADADPSGALMMSVRDDEVGSTAATSTDGDIQSVRSDKFGAVKVTQLPDATSEVKFAVINAATGDNTIVAAAGAGIKIRVINVVCVAGGTTDCRFESGAGGSALTGVMKLVVNSGFAPGLDPYGHFETAENALLNLECTGDIDGWLKYVEV